jgi:hypothetical protein
MVNKQLIVAGGALLVGAGIGFGTGYLVFKKKFEARAEEEIASVRESYAKASRPKPDIATLAKDIPAPNLEETDGIDDLTQPYEAGGDETDAEEFRRAYDRVPTNEELVLMGQGVPVTSVTRNPSDHDDDGVTEGNIFDQPEPDPEDVGEGVNEEPPGSLDRPFVISKDEWYANETDYDQITLTYWADDDVLADDRYRQVSEIEEIVGATNLHRFGFKSDDPDIVYVRNHSRKADFEITKDERNFGEIVHGVDPDEKSGVPRRMRSNDD